MVRDKAQFSYSHGFTRVPALASCHDQAGYGRGAPFKQGKTYEDLETAIPIDLITGDQVFLNLRPAEARSTLGLPLRWQIRTLEGGAPRGTLLRA
jgi:hypothetical protein